MSYGETKVYFDGSHYIAIPHTTRPTKKRPKPPEEIIEVLEENEIKDFGEPESSILLNDIENDNNSILTDKVSKILHVNHKDILNIKINKKSLDARKKDNLFKVFRGENSNGNFFRGGSFASAGVAA